MNKTAKAVVTTFYQENLLYCLRQYFSTIFRLRCGAVVYEGEYLTEKFHRIGITNGEVLIFLLIIVRILLFRVWIFSVTIVGLVVIFACREFNLIKFVRVSRSFSYCVHWGSMSILNSSSRCCLGVSVWPFLDL